MSGVAMLMRVSGRVAEGDQALESVIVLAAAIGVA